MQTFSFNNANPSVSSSTITANPPTLLNLPNSGEQNAIKGIFCFSCKLVRSEKHSIYSKI